MCYLCLLQDDPFSFKSPSTSERKRQRLMEIKNLLKAAENVNTCDVADIEVKKLKEEQYVLSREM